MDQNKRRERQTSEAAHWWRVVFLRSSNELSTVERQAFLRWLRESPVNVAELLHMAHVHDTLGRFKLWEEVKNEVEASPVQAADVVSFAEYRRVMLPIVEEHSRSRKWLRASGIVATAAAIIIAFFIVPAYFGQTISTAHGERRVVTLNDGSIVQLDPETTLRVRFKKHEREMTLRQGRALFRVAKDPQHPFLVLANGTVVRAVGTIFGVEERSDKNVVVTVSEGKVAVLPRLDYALAVERDEKKVSLRSEQKQTRGSVKDASYNDAIYLSAGKQLTIANSGAEPVRSVDAVSELSWANGRLVFVAAPLGEAVDEFNRYTHLRMSVSDQQLARRPISGVFDVTDPESFIAFIEAGTGARVSREQDTIVISPFERNGG
jgi:transmembrane sensor